MSPPPQPPTDHLRNRLIAAVNANPITVDDAWALIHEWDRLVGALAAAEQERDEALDLAEARFLEIGSVYRATYAEGQAEVATVTDRALAAEARVVELTQALERAGKRSDNLQGREV